MFAFLNVLTTFRKNLSETFTLHEVFQLPKTVILMFIVSQTAIHSYGTGSDSTCNCKYLSCTIYLTPRKYVTIAKTKVWGYTMNLFEEKQLKGISNILLTIVIMHFEGNPIENTKYNLVKCLFKFLCLESRCLSNK